MERLKKLFDAEDSEALVRLGTELFRDGEETLAFEYYRAACKLGNPVAMGNLGYCYQAGRGVAPNLKMAAYCFERAAELDDIGSMLKLGDFHAKGKGGLTPNSEAAFGCYLRAYEIASASSESDPVLLAELCYRIGVCKKNGKGTPRDYESAYEFLQSAAELLSEFSDGSIRTETLLRRIEEGLNECETHF